MWKIMTIFLALLLLALGVILIRERRLQAKPEMGRDVTVKQEPGKIVYWVLPGPRRLSEQLFGTPQYPRQTGELNLEQADGLVKDLFRDFPIIAGVPLSLRVTNEDGTAFTETTRPTPVSDQGRIVTGQFEITYKDRQPYDLPGEPTATSDKVDITISFTDPAGNEYQLEVRSLYQPPFPNFESGGGVITDAWLHGSTGNDSPLFPKIFTYGAFWGIGDVIINGQLVDEDKWIHFMTTQTVRDRDYRLAIGEELPLRPDETIAGQIHHTHVVVRPIKITPEGPVYDPVKTAFTLPNGEKQPFIHIMFEQDTLVGDDFQNWSFPPTTESNETPTTESPNVITVEGSEFTFNPSEITLDEGTAVTIIFKNVGTIAHNFTIGELGIATDTIQPGEAAEITFTPTKSGSFAFWCNVPGHREAGMEGILGVR